MGFLGQNRGRNDAMSTPNKLVFTFGCSYVCAKFGENVSVRVRTDGYTDTLTDGNRFYNLCHTICYSYGTDNNNDILIFMRSQSRKITEDTTN